MKDNLQVRRMRTGRKNAKRAEYEYYIFNTATLKKLHQEACLYTLATKKKAEEFIENFEMKDNYRWF